MSDDESELAVDEFVDYCRTQSGLLAGRVDTLRSEVGDLLDDIDDEIAAARDHLETRKTDAARTVSPESPERPEADVDVTDIEALGEDLETKQAVVEAEQARMAAFQELASGYADLAESLAAAAEDGHDALERVVDFEARHDAPAYFEDRKTILEAASDSGDDDDDADAVVASDDAADSMGGDDTVDSMDDESPSDAEVN